MVLGSSPVAVTRRLEYRKTSKARNTITKQKKLLGASCRDNNNEKKPIENVLDKDMSLANIIFTIFCEQGITIISVFTALPMTISTILLAITGVFGRGGGGGPASSPKDEGSWKKWLDAGKRLVDDLRSLAGKAVEAWPALVGSVIGVILSFLGKPVGFVAEHTWVLNVFVAGLIGGMVDAKS